MKWTFTTIVSGKRRAGLPTPGSKISIVFETDETRPNTLIMSLYHKGLLYTDGDISIAASIMPLSAIVEEVEKQDERNQHRDQIQVEVIRFLKAFHLLEEFKQSGATATFFFMMETSRSMSR